MIVSGSTNPLLLGQSSGYNLTRSLRTRASASGYLNRTPATTTNQKTFTYSFWVKRGILSTAYKPISAGTSGSEFGIQFMAGNGIEFYNYTGAYDFVLDTTQVFCDPSAWYHIVAVVDTTQATASNRVLLYVNGVQVTSFTTATYPSLNFNTFVNKSGTGMFVGALPSSQFFDGYLAEVNFIDGQALTPSSFGSTNALTGVWQPARYTGTYGTNGFYLPFTDNSALTTSSNVGLGKDFSGNGNYFATNNISITAGVTYDSMTDVPTLTSATAANFAVLNPLDKPNGIASNGNLQFTYSSTTQGASIRSTIGVTSGKWYCEVVLTSYGGNNPQIGIIGVGENISANVDSYVGKYATGYAYNLATGNKLNNTTATVYGSSLSAGDTAGIAFDADARTITFYKNNVSQGTAFSSIPSGAYCFAVSSLFSTVLDINFGQRPFTYTPPTGYVALNTFNLPDSTIVKGNTVMDATLYTGTLLSNAVTNAASFKPDLVWVKSRSAATDNKLTDSVRGVTKAWVSNSATAETTDTQGLTAFGSAGFTVGTDTNYNNLAATYVGWQWQAGQGSSSSNTNGTITSTVSVNASAGFSVVSFTGNGTSGATVGHSLGVAPSFIIIKRRATPPSVPDSIVYHSSLGNTGALVLDQTVGTQTSSAFWNNTSPTSSVISLGNDANTNNSGNTFIAYCWTPIAGFSAFGSYTGNGSTDGPMIYTGFQPKFVMFKISSAAGNWFIRDTARDAYNVSTTSLYPNLSDVENAAAAAVDILSNGFKLRNSTSGVNGSGETLIYAAFASNPFKNALAR